MGAETFSTWPKEGGVIAHRIGKGEFPRRPGAKLQPLLRQYLSHNPRIWSHNFRGSPSQLDIITVVEILEGPSAHKDRPLHQDANTLYWRDHTGNKN